VAGFEELRAHFRRAVTEGDLPLSADVETLANFVQTVNFGLTVQASTGSNVFPLDDRSAERFSPAASGRPVGAIQKREITQPRRNERGVRMQTLVRVYSVLHDRRKRLRIQRRPADQRSVDLLLRHKR
jgi:hypothetical protein